MHWLAIDTTCDESCAAIVDVQGRRLLSDVVHTHIDEMRAYGGVVPELASRGHVRGLPLVVSEALRQAGLVPSQLHGIGVSNRPGLIGALLVGVAYAKAMSFALNVPLLALNHVEGHLYSPLLATLEGEEAPKFPWIGLVVSGGHTELFKVNGPLEHQWIGGTLDDAAGEAFDKVGKLLSLPYPAGPYIDKWVQSSATGPDRTYYKFPIARTKSNLDFSFSGLKTAVALKTQKLYGSNSMNEQSKLRIGASAQEAIVQALAAKLETARVMTGISQIVVTGGVACNSRLRALLPNAHFPKPRFCTDNAAMIANLALQYVETGKANYSPASISANASGRADFRTGVGSP